MPAYVDCRAPGVHVPISATAERGPGAAAATAQWPPRARPALSVGGRMLASATATRWVAAASDFHWVVLGREPHSNHQRS